MSSTDQDTRIRIMEAAARLLEQHQGQGVRMSDVAREAGLSRQAVYLHFGNRANLLVETARYGDVVELHRLYRNGTQHRLGSLRGSATRLSPRSDGKVVFIGSELGGVSGIWIADSHGIRCLTNCDLRVGRPWGDAYRTLPGETDTVRFVESRVEWQTAEGRSEFAPVTPTPSLPTRVTP